MQDRLGSYYGLTAFALTGVRCQRLEHGYLPQNHYYSELEPIYEDRVTGPARKLSTPRRSPSPINVLTNGSLCNNYDDSNKPGNSPGNKRSRMTRSASDVTLNTSSRMLSDIMFRKYRQNSLPCLTAYKTTSIDIEHSLDEESASSSIESLMIDLSSPATPGSKMRAEITSSTGRSSIYQGHIGSTMLSQYILDTSEQETIETFKRPKPEETNIKPSLLCASEKKIRKRLFLLCFSIFVVVVILFLVSIMTGWIYPRSTHTNYPSHHMDHHPIGTDFATPRGVNETDS